MKQYVAKLSAIVWAALLTGMFLVGRSWGQEFQNNATAFGESPFGESASEVIAKSGNWDLQLAKTLFENKDCMKAFQTFKKYAETGDDEAEAWLARCYLDGVGTSVNFTKAYEYFRRAAAKNNPWGVNGLGECFQYGYGTTMNLQTAKDLYFKAANMNHPLGTLNLARLYADKYGGFFNPEQAELFYRRAVELNAHGAKSDYAEYLFIKERYAEAIHLAQASIEEPQSMEIMADCYENGWGVPLDISRAVKLAEAHFNKKGPAAWSAQIFYNAGLEEQIINGMTELAKYYFSYAAEQGHRESQYIHARNLVKSNKTNAFKYMHRAADNGHVRAMIEAGKMVVEENSYTSDLDRYTSALRYFSKAALDIRVQEEAIINLSNIYHYKVKEPKKGLFWDQMGLALGIDWCRLQIALSELSQNGDEHFAKGAALLAESKANKAEIAEKCLSDILSTDYERLRSLADKGNADALLALGMIGCLEEKGHPNVAIGLELLEKAAALKNARACYYLGNIYRDGVLVKKDLKKALEWYQKGAEDGDAESAETAAKMLYYEGEFRETKLDDFKKTFDRALELEVFSVAFEYGNIMEFVAKDLKKAEELYRISAAHNDTRAMMRLYYMLKNDEGAFLESYSFLCNASNLEYSAAELERGNYQKFYKQPRRSFIYYLKAFLHGDEKDAPYRLAECWLNGYGCKVNLKCFWNFANKAYENHCAEVCYLLGTVYQDGKICAQDQKKAKEYFEEGAKRGSEQCKEALKEF